MKKSKGKYFNIAKNDYFVGQSFLGLKNYGLARKHYDSSLLLLKKNNTAKDGR
jgi:hypothetical protein